MQQVYVIWYELSDPDLEFPSKVITGVYEDPVQGYREAELMLNEEKFMYEEGFVIHTTPTVFYHYHGSEARAPDPTIKVNTPIKEL